MPVLIRNAKVVAGEKTLNGASVLVSGRTIAKVGAKVKAPKGAEVIDARGGILGPGFVDIHMHGAFGTNLSDASVEEILEVSRRLTKAGVTAYVPTLFSIPLEKTVLAIRRITEAAKREEGARILGVHLEGPYLNPVRRGAHREDFLRTPSVREFQTFLRAAHGRVRVMTIAPELPGALEVIRLGRKKGVLMSAGHSMATNEQFDKAVAAGLRHVTHMYNAMRPFHHRAEGIMEQALVDDRVSCEIIYDRRHISRSAAKLVLKCKGVGRLVLVSDGMFAAGLPDGRYHADGNDYEVQGGEIRVSGGPLGGSLISVLDAARNVSQDFGLGPGEVFRAAAANPARLLGTKLGEIAPGRPADLVLFAKGWKPSAVWVRGKRWK